MSTFVHESRFRYVRPDASHLPGGTGTGDGLTIETAWAGFSSIPNVTLSAAAGNELYCAGDFTLSANVQLPGWKDSSATSRMKVRSHPDYPATIKAPPGTAYYMVINRSNTDFFDFTFIGAKSAILYFYGNLSNIKFWNCKFVGTDYTAAAVIRLDDAGGFTMTDIAFDENCLLTGTSYYGLRWQVWGTTTTVNVLKRITIDMQVRDFVSRRAAIEFRTDRGCPAGNRMESIYVNKGIATNITGIAYEFSDANNTSADFQFNAYVDGVIPVAADDTPPKAGELKDKLGGALGIAGFNELNGKENILQGTFKNITGIGGGIDTFYGGYVIENAYFENIGSEEGYIDGSAIIADTGTYKLIIRGNVRAKNIKGDRVAGPSNLAGGTGLTILQADNVQVEGFIAENCRVGISYGNPVMYYYIPVMSMTNAGNVVTVTMGKNGTKQAHGLVTGTKILWSKDLMPAEYRGVYPITVVDEFSFTYTLMAAPSGPVTTLAGFNYLKTQSSVIRKSQFLSCNSTTWLAGALNDQMDNNILEECTLTVANPSIPLFIYWPKTTWTKEANNLYAGTVKLDSQAKFTMASTNSVNLTLHSSSFDSDNVNSLPAPFVNGTGAALVRSTNSVSTANSLGWTSNAEGDAVFVKSGAARTNMAISYRQKQLLGGAVRPLVGAIVRSNQGNTDNYTVQFDNFDGATGTVVLRKKQSGVYSQVASKNINFAMAQGDVVAVRVECVGTTINVYLGKDAISNAPVATFSDGAVTGAGWAGFYNAKGGQTVDMSIDDVSFDQINSAITTPAAPTNATAVAGNFSAVVTFLPPVSDGGSAITSYTVTASPGGVKAVGSDSPITIQGLNNGVTYTFTVHATNGLGDSSESGPSNAVTTAAASPGGNLIKTTSMLFSPYNWDLTANTAKTINAGAYFSFIFGGASCTLNFDMANLVAPFPQISYRVDGYGAWVTVEVAASVPIAMPADTAIYATKGGHLLEVVVKSTSEKVARWSTQAAAVCLTGVILEANTTLSAPPSRPQRALIFGDSITEGVRTVNATAVNDTDRNDAKQSWAFALRDMLGMEIGVVGFGGTGFITSGAGGVPALPTTYNQLYNGKARSFTPAPHLVVLMEGTNDVGDVTSAATTVLNGIIAATPDDTKIVVLRPFSDDTHAAELKAAIAASTKPGRSTYVDTTNWFNKPNSVDWLHPNGLENLTHIAPLAASALRAVLAKPRYLPKRTISLVLTDKGNGKMSTTTNLKWAFFDQINPGDFTAPASQGKVEEIDANGNLVIEVGTSLPSGGVGWLVITDSNGSLVQRPVYRSFTGPVQVT